MGSDGQRNKTEKAEASNGESILSPHMQCVKPLTFFVRFSDSIKNWPCTNDSSKAALEMLQSTYHLILVPVYQYEGGLMYFHYYKQMLTGAIVEGHFTLTHLSIGTRPGQRQESIDAYTPELFSMYLLRKPLPPIVSPHKHKVSSEDLTDLESPTKKSKLT